MDERQRGSSTGSYGAESQAIYYEVSSRAVWSIRIVGVITILMVLIAFIICLVRASNNHIHYLLACNIIISCLLGIVNVWWYKRGHLAADKYWYMLLLGAVIIWQCIATEVYVFNLKSEIPDVTTESPLTTGTTEVTTTGKH